MIHEADLPGRPSLHTSRTKRRGETTHRSTCSITLKSSHSTRSTPSSATAGIVFRRGGMGQRFPEPSLDVSKLPPAVCRTRLRSEVGYFLYLDGYSHDSLLAFGYSFVYCVPVPFLGRLTFSS